MLLSLVVPALLFACTSAPVDQAQEDVRQRKEEVVKQEEPEPPVVVPLAACADTVEGIPLAEGLVEDEAGYDARLATIDTSTLPELIDIGGVDGLMRGVLAYALEVPPEELADQLIRDEVLSKGPLGEAVLAAFATEEADPLDVRMLRRGLHRFYACDRGLPTTLDGFRALYGDFKELDSVVIEDSRPKNGPRRLFSDPDSGLYIAESLEEGDFVRETEIVIEGARLDGMLDFAVYDERGALSAASRFATNGGGTVSSASPYTCLFCHMNRDSFRFDVVHPD